MTEPLLQAVPDTDPSPRPALPTAAREKAGQNSSIIHTKVASDSGTTRGYAALVPGVVALRYGPEAMREFVRDYTPRFIENKTRNLVQPVQDYLFGGPRGEAAEAEALSRAQHHFSRYFVRESAEQATETLRGHRTEFLAAHGGKPAAQYLETLKDMPKGEAISGMIGGLKKAALRQHAYMYWYDLPLGGLSAALSLRYNRHVAENMRNLFAEAVAYETGKDVDDSGARDLARSDNPIVQGTLKNFHWKEFERYGTDAIFAGRLLGKLPGLSRLSGLHFGAAGIAGKALLVFSENMRHEQTTLYEDLVALAETKLNPSRGIGRPVEAAELASIYQKYALKYAKDKSLKDAMAAQNSDTMNWAEAEPIFERMASLMNLTYKYKYDMVKEAPKPGEVADFTLPKLIYLLGHGMIDPYKPEQTLAFVEVANRDGIEAVKTLSAALAQGQPLGRALGANPVDLGMLDRQTRERLAAEVTPPVTRLPDAANENAPTTKIAADAVHHRTVETPELARA